MTLRNLLKGYGFNKCVSIYTVDWDYRKEYCDKRRFSECEGRQIEKNLECWNEIKNKKVKRWNIIGDGVHIIELCIELEQ